MQEIWLFAYLELYILAVQAAAPVGYPVSHSSDRRRLEAFLFHFGDIGAGENGVTELPVPVRHEDGLDDRAVIADLGVLPM